MDNLSPAIQVAIQEKAKEILADPEQTLVLAKQLEMSPKDFIGILESASKPSSPSTDNHETGFWKGAAVVAIGVLIGLGFLAANKD